MRRPKSRLTVAVLASAALLLSACSEDGGEDPGATGEGDQATGGSFSVSEAEPEAFAPTSACYSSGCSQVISMVFDPLVQVDPETQETKYVAAESIEPSEDGLTWTVKLRDGLTFHNGEPADAEAYIRAWNYSAYGPNATQVGFFFSPVEGYDDLQVPEGAGANAKPAAKEMSGLTAVDDTTIEITLAEPFSQWPLTMGYNPAFAPMAQECMDDIEACNESPIGTGPYQFAEPWQHNQSITLERYEDYQGEDPGNADEIEVKLYANLTTAFRDYQAGNLDIVDAVDPSQIPQARTVAGDRIVEVDSGSFSYFGFPLYEPEFQDVRVRQALSLAIDRQQIIDSVLNGLYTPAADVISPFVPGSRDDACEYCVYDAEQAAQLYEEANGPDTLNIWFNNDGGHEQWVQAMAQGWQDDLGIEYEFKSQPFTPYLAALDTRSKVDGPYRLGWLPDYPSPENYLDPIYGEGSSNYGNWGCCGTEDTHQEFLDLVAEGDAAPTVEEGIPSYQASADVVLDNMIVIPLWFGRTFIPYSENVDNVGYSPLDQILLRDVTVTS